jgi:hypothetical protein
MLWKCGGVQYLGSIANQNYSHDEVNSSLKSGNACCHSVQDIFVFHFGTEKCKN